MTAKEKQVLENQLNIWRDSYDCAIVFDSDSRQVDRAYTRYCELLDLIQLLGLEYKAESITKVLLTTEYTTVHYTVY